MKMNDLKYFFSFSIDFDTVDVYTNEEDTRTFIGIRVHLGYDSLMECVRRIDSAFADFKLPVYYQVNIQFS